MVELILGILCVTLGAVLRIKDKFPGIDLCCVSIGWAFLIMYIISNSPTAMDVYQGKTTLEITYRDGVPVDSVVVFKLKEK